MRCAANHAECDEPSGCATGSVAKRAAICAAHCQKTVVISSCDDAQRKTRCRRATRLSNALALIRKRVAPSFEACPENRR